MRLNVRKLSYALGASITGVDLAERLTDAMLRDIRQAWLEHQVVVFPGQRLAERQQIEFGQRFGRLDDHKSIPFYLHPDHPEIFLITNRKIGGKPSETRDTGREWHSDHSFTTHPTMATMLYCREIPPVGGTTMFSNMYMAYETLSSGLRDILDKLEAVHSLTYYFDRKPHGRDPKTASRDEGT